MLSQKPSSTTQNPSNSTHLNGFEITAPIFLLLIIDVQVFSQEELYSEANIYEYGEKMQKYTKSIQEGSPDEEAV